MADRKIPGPAWFFRGTILGGFYLVLQRFSREIVPTVHSDNQLSNASFIGFPFFLVSLSPVPHCLPKILSQTIVTKVFVSVLL